MIPSETGRGMQGEGVTRLWSRSGLEGRGFDSHMESQRILWSSKSRGKLSVRDSHYQAKSGGTGRLCSQEAWARVSGLFYCLPHCLPHCVHCCKLVDWNQPWRAGREDHAWGWGLFSLRPQRQVTEALIIEHLSVTQLQRVQEGTLWQFSADLYWQLVVSDALEGVAMCHQRCGHHLSGLRSFAQTLKSLQDLSWPHPSLGRGDTL